MAQNTDKDILCGRNAVLELLRSGREIHKLWLKSGSGRNNDIRRAAAERGIPVQNADEAALSRLTGAARHQGVAAWTAAVEYADVDDILAAAAAGGEEAFIVALDEVEDPQNLGAILRSAEGMGVHGVLIPKRRSAGLTAAVARAAAGAMEYVPVARVGNMARTLALLKEQGLWITGAEQDGAPIAGADLTGPRALVLGGEDKGLGHTVRAACDEIVALPLLGRVSSYNVSAAAAIFMYETRRQRTAAAKRDGS
ncbi:MAG: 23S rRNA (guanosine(2251)-2'-O)-methyltransferase RlmB [Gracilibacteraceae bacterium]|jgi:23S rRNA (guanosine2251-2'-O)-methyltransferase|nr:23S rRNA (guanosine(2251)-2'-O)-methyltransferase RlmB [Gracilibacteraceae bacterium]